MRRPVQASLVLFAFAVVLGGCASKPIPDPQGRPPQVIAPDQKGRVGGTGIDPQDLVTVCDRMARGILNCPRILNATSPPCILVEPVANETRFRINRSLFLERIMAQLNSKTDNKVVFLDREHMNQLLQERNLAQSGQVTSSGNPYVQEFKGADFLLTGKLQGLSSVTSAGQSDYVFYTFILIDTRTTERVWQDAAEIRKEAQEDAVYR